MEEKERYEIFGEFGIIHDTSPNAECMLLNKFQTCEILNQQDKEIKQLKQSQKKLAIEELEKPRQWVNGIIENNIKNFGKNVEPNFETLSTLLDNQIKELGGGENE